MNLNKASLMLFFLTTTDVMAHSQRSLTSSIIINTLPIIIFVVVWIILMKIFGNKTASINEKIIESNNEVAKQVKRIADHLEKDS